MAKHTPPLAPRPLPWLLGPPSLFSAGLALPSPQAGVGQAILASSCPAWL